jgi:hypothetical protein
VTPPARRRPCPSDAPEAHPSEFLIGVPPPVGRSRSKDQYRDRQASRLLRGCLTVSGRERSSLSSRNHRRRLGRSPDARRRRDCRRLKSAAETTAWCVGLRPAVGLRPPSKPGSFFAGLSGLATARARARDGVRL